MEIERYFTLNEADRAARRAQIGQSDWRAGQYLAELLAADGAALRARCGEEAEVLLLTDAEQLAGFCTLAAQDEIEASVWGPWVGFLYVFPPYRGRRCAGLLLDAACARAKAAGHRALYLSTEEVGLYEKYGFALLAEAVPTVYGGTARVYARRA